MPIVKCSYFLLLLCLQIALAGCVSVGGTAIRGSRTDYNQAIHDTSVEQLLLNIVRVHDSEIPTFMDLTEVDASNSVSASLTAGDLGTIPAHTIAAMMGTATYTDAPIARYIPLGGYPLIQQVTLPINLNSIARLTDSNWPDATLFYYSFQRLTPSFLDFYRAVDTILALDSYGAISFQAPSDNELRISFQNEGNLRIPAGNWRKTLTPGAKVLPCVPTMNSAVMVRQLWNELKGIYGGGSGNTIILGTAGLRTKHVTVAPRAALGALKEAETDHMLFTTHETAEAIREANISDACSLGEFYYSPAPPVELNEYGEKISELWKQHFDAVYMHNNASQSSREQFRYLGQRRVYILVEVSAQRPPDAYASIFKDGQWYSISASDRISKQNFALLSEILTIQAVPTPSGAPASTSITLNH